MPKTNIKSRLWRVEKLPEYFRYDGIIFEAQRGQHFVKKGLFGLEELIEGGKIGDLPGKRVGLEVWFDQLEAEDEELPELVLVAYEESVKLESEQTGYQDLPSPIFLPDFPK